MDHGMRLHVRVVTCLHALALPGMGGATLWEHAAHPRIGMHTV